MDIFNDLYPVCLENPYTSNLSDQEEQEHKEFVALGKKRKKELSFDDYCTVYSDELWNLWCLVEDFRNNNKPILNTMDFPTFCSMCYENSLKY
jgi:hypothetical protein